MTLDIGRKHWIVFAVLVAAQVLGMWVTAHRNPTSDWIYFPMFAVPKNPFGMVTAAVFVISSCLVSALIMITLWDTVRQTPR